MCKQTAAAEKTGAFSCLVIEPPQTFVLLLTHTDSQTLFPQKPANIAHNTNPSGTLPSESRALSSGACVCVWKCVYLFFFFVVAWACVCVRSEVHTNLICPSSEDRLQWKICRLFYARKLECGDRSKNTSLRLLARNMPVKIKFKFTLAVLVPLRKKTCLGAGCGLGV